ncbi:MAG: hypothetical protein LN588_01290, partial [Rickettsia endosymbiont of Bryobia graminum]|nr:hypothetical protein [Rickettsia endosymbiont of Bryobia graminum]
CVRLVLSYDVPSTSLFVLLSIHSYSQCPKLYNSSPIFATLHLLRTVYYNIMITKIWVALISLVNKC